LWMKDESDTGKKGSEAAVEFQFWEAFGYTPGVLAIAPPTRVVRGKSAEPIEK